MAAVKNPALKDSCTNFPSYFSSPDSEVEALFHLVSCYFSSQSLQLPPKTSEGPKVEFFFFFNRKKNALALHSGPYILYSSLMPRLVFLSFPPDGTAFRWHSHAIIVWATSYLFQAAPSVAQFQKRFSSSPHARHLTRGLLPERVHFCFFVFVGAKQSI